MSIAVCLVMKDSSIDMDHKKLNFQCQDAGVYFSRINRIESRLCFVECSDCP